MGRAWQGTRGTKVREKEINEEQNWERGLKGGIIHPKTQEAPRRDFGFGEAGDDRKECLKRHLYYWAEFREGGLKKKV